MRSGRSSIKVDFSRQTFIDGSNASGKNEDHGLDIYVSHTYHSLRIPKRIAELTYLTFVKLGAVDTSDFSDPLTGSGLGNNDSDDRETFRRMLNFQFATRQLRTEVRIRFRSRRTTQAIVRRFDETRRQNSPRGVLQIRPIWRRKNRSARAS